MQTITPPMLEQAARHLCTLRRVNPDESVPNLMPGAIVGSVMPAWRLFEAEISTFLQVQQAVGCAVNGLNLDGTPAGLKLVPVDGALPRPA